MKIKGGKTHLKSLTGVKPEELNHYMKPTSQEYKYDNSYGHQ